jgi:phospholipase/carboxylesterase
MIPDSMTNMDMLAERLVAALESFESAQRTYFPGIVPRLREQFPSTIGALREAIDSFEGIPASSGKGALQHQLVEAAGLCLDAMNLGIASDSMEEALANFRKAGRRINRSQELLLALCPFIPAVNRFFLEPALRDRASEFLSDTGPEPSSGLFHGGLEEDPYARGSVSFYVPETRNRPEPFPLVVALHGGLGHGRDFIWTWLREARSRRFALACPSSSNITWTIMGPDADALLLHKVLVYADDKWNIDHGRILLTGLSDGATYVLKRSLDTQTPFTHFAVVSGVLAPFDLAYAKGRRIFWVHGEKDWMFPAWRAKAGAKELAAAGADVTLEIVPDLYHAYPREKNDRILGWFDSRLALPGGTR